MDRIQSQPHGLPLSTPAVLPTVLSVSFPGQPPGRAFDGRRFLAAAVEFSRELRAAGLAIDLGAVIDFARSLDLVQVGDREEVHGAGQAIFVRHREDRAAYDRVFARFWRSSTRFRGPTFQPPTTIVDEREAGPDAQQKKTAEEASAAATGAARQPSPEDRVGMDEAAGDGFEGIAISPMAYSRDTVDRHRQFDRMSAAELREAERFIDLLTPNLELRRTRRRELHARGRVLAPRVMFRRNLKTGGDPLDWLWQRAVRRPRALVVICDISGSMERNSRLLLRFTQALASSAVRTEAFVFGTRLTRVTRLLRGRDRSAALARVAEATTDWSGGTRIGDCLREFNQRWARRVLRSSGVVVVVSDGWDRGDPSIVGNEMARLQRSCHRLIWLNPLASTQGYRPLAAGMAAALPYVDDFVPAGTLASLERLAVILSDTTARRVRGQARPSKASGAVAPAAGRPTAAGLPSAFAPTIAPEATT